MNTLFDLSALAQAESAAPVHWVLFYTHASSEYVARRVLPVKDEGSSFEWLPSDQLGRKLPTRFTRYGDAQRTANQLNRSLSESGERAGIVVQVRRWN